MTESLSPRTGRIVALAVASHTGECGKETARMKVEVLVGDEVEDEAIALWGNGSFKCPRCRNRIQVIPVRMG